jgi:hypothetical protein
VISILTESGAYSRCLDNCQGKCDLAARVSPHRGTDTFIRSLRMHEASESSLYSVSCIDLARLRLSISSGAFQTSSRRAEGIERLRLTLSPEARFFNLKPDCPLTVQ